MLVAPDQAAVLVTLEREQATVLMGRGTASAAVGLAARWAAQTGRAGWMSLPRPVDVPPALLDDLGLRPFSTWDWLSCASPPPVVPGESEVELLEPEDDAAIRDCLDAANPTTSASPGTGLGTWWGVRAPDAVDGRLLGVLSVVHRPGDPDATDRSWHLRGLSVRPESRNAGWGRALTAAVLRSALTAHDGAAPEADWVSLGMYADNAAARRVYEGLGFAVDAEFASFGPAGADRPPA
ncbi:GNAT family N-acetyltransferase [Actinotalea sp. BY-33]|uniref:GNAT family N-acetyltransferase n=1 Tax=Actinotalea soli TaxID=2819234 RepID=A0A939LSC8_9CELL|nr:GNAT family N-acetyltransferase [Actinotalea soli]MBO1750467.1 GNAT family N-acetyltransferase [Actinotalea soli]